MTSSTDIYLADDAGQRSAIRCELLYSQLWSGKDGRNARIKWHYLARLWPAHLAAQLGGPVSTHIVGPDTHEVLAPLSAADAAAELKSLMGLWQQNLQAPLPTCVKTGCTLLSTASGKDPVAAAQEMYYGPYQQRGEVDDHYVLFRLWPDFDDLLQQGLEHSSQQLYGRLVQHWQQHRALPTSENITDCP